MSMFHELMMRKKEQIMYATIKGTLTENDGVFSGFSDGKNYLLMQQSFTPQDKSWKIRATFTTGSDRENAKALFVGNTGTGNYGGFIFGTYSRHFWFNIGSTGTSWNIQATGQSTNVIEINTQYTVEFGFTGTEYFIDNIENGVATRVFTVSSSTPIYQNGSFTIGLRLNDSNNWIGSIDLNNSYIKLGSTKYNLQAVVGYTVVGSPTITDGVVTDFSSSNYLKINKTITANKIEISVPFSLSAKGWNDIFWGDTSSQTKLLAETNPSGSLNLYFTQGISGNIFITIYAVDTQYRLNFVVTYDTFSYKLINEDTNTIVKEETIERTTKASPYLNISAFGRSAPNTTIPIKDSWIKIDGKLWFNGQQA